LGTILKLPGKVKKLEKEDPDSFKIFMDIFQLSSSEGRMEFPETFQNKAWQYFGVKKQGHITESKDQVIKRLKKQRIINIYNDWTGEGSLFNSLRAERPGISVDEREKEHKLIDKYVQESSQDCDFCQPKKYTPEDVFGRVKGKH
jgi:hypothetical protein